MLGWPIEAAFIPVCGLLGGYNEWPSRALPGRRFIHTHTGIGYRFSPQA